MTTGGAHPYRARRPRRGPWALFPLAIAAWAVAEIWLLLALGEAAGGLTVFLLLAAGVVLGAVVIKRAGQRAWQRLAESVRSGAGPRPGGGQALTMLGGLLLMVPGLLSDVLGLLCLFPPTAALLRRGAARYVERRAGPLTAAFDEAARRRGPTPPNGRVVPGEVVHDDPGEDDPGRHPR
ncbi:FxsA family membrane protein [Streptomyces sp. DSM 44917]|uniref:FxsA family membrane protein n=1 Tax=Streptomyces boetiae TaxID=3075541 RepID=A0ABU2LCW5_9ACTN|nr:FxsA family membrane protein [Streptomyces sp. DSM 44917]MDT0309423.1 FxsA family membrane protein [Streptomyces sp. DSM 44917]